MEPRDDAQRPKQTQSYFEDSVQIVDSRVCPSCGLKVSASTTICPNDNTQLVSIPKAGTMLSGKYELIEEIGTGGMGVIFKARQPNSDKLFAIKMLHTHRLAEQGLLRFEQEAKAGFNLRHPNIIGIHDFGVTDQGQPFLVMDYIKGTTLGDFIEVGGPLSIEKAIKIATQICQGIKHAHERGILHRDLKSSNVMLVNAASDDPQALVVDFGMAKIVDPDGGSTSSKQLTKTGEVFGSPMYMSPEQCMGKKLDQRSDIYSFGCVLFEMLTGSPPILGDSIVETVFKQVNEAAPTLRDVAKGKKFPPGVEALVSRCLAKNVDERFQNMGEIESALKVWKKQKFFTSHKKLGETSSNPLANFSFASEGISKPVVILVAVLVVALIGGLIVTFMSVSNSMNPVSKVETRPIDQIKSYSKESLIADGNDFAKVAIASDPETKYLEMTGNTFLSDEDMQRIASLHKLEVLHLAYTSVTDRGLPNLEKLPLKELSLSATDISSDGLASVAKVKTLEILRLKGTSIRDEALKYLKELPNLKELDISGCIITDDGLKNLAQIRSLEKLTMDGIEHKKAYFTADGLANLAKLPNLKELSLANTSLTDENIVGLIHIKNLKVLNLAHNKLTTKGLSKLASMKLGTVGLTGMPMGDDAVAVLLPAVKGLDVKDTKITDACLVKVAAVPGFRELCLQGTSVSDAGLKLVGTIKSLTRLELGGRTSHIDDAGLKSLTNLHNLETFQIRYVPVSESVVAILKNNPNLKEIELSNTDVGDSIIAPLTKMPHLETLFLNKTRVTAQGVQPLGKVQSLKELMLIETPASAAEEAVKPLVNALPKCKVMLTKRGM